MDDTLERVPDGIAPLTGYRIWRASLEGDQAALFPMNTSTPDWSGASSGWVSASCAFFGPVPSRIAIAFTQLGVGPDQLAAFDRHAAPDEACGCGFYAFNKLDPDLFDVVAHHASTLAPDAPEEHVIIGRVELAGKVIEHERGYRAERARIVELIPVRGSNAPVRDLARRLGLGLAPMATAPQPPGSPSRWRITQAAWTESKGFEARRADALAMSGILLTIGRLGFLADVTAAPPSDPETFAVRLIWIVFFFGRFAAALRRDPSGSRNTASTPGGR